ncbi:hypothetical protein NIES25_39060 [Nostoc linckia NIES-25]|nr:hypothetical protein NIES25_39060 [Nostoc linckia NIES-25]
MFLLFYVVASITTDMNTDELFMVVYEKTDK